MADSQQQLQFSQMFKEAMSPVHGALQIPQPYQIAAPPPPYLYNVATQPWLMSPQTPHPNYNERYNIGSAVSNKISRVVANAAIAQDVRMQTPYQWGVDQGFNPGMDPMSKRMAAAEELSIRSSSQHGLGGMGPFGSFTGALTTAATIGSFMLPGFGITNAALRFGAHMLAGTALGTGANYLGSMLDRTVFGGATDLRKGGHMLRSSMNVSNLGSTFGLDESGIMRHDTAQQVANQVTRLSQEDSRFSAKEFLQITDKMANTGMLQGVSSTHDIVNRVKSVSRQLSVFMKVASEPDVIEALKQMAELRSMGFADANLSQAASNARTFARMAGVNRSKIHGAGLQAGQMFQQMGLSGAAGYDAGMFLRGMSGPALSMFTRGQQQAFGGAGGLAQNMAMGIGGAQQHVTADMMLHTFFQSQGGGRFSLDSGALNKFMQGGNLSEMFNNKIKQLNYSGNMMQHIQDFKERLPELRETLQQKLGGPGMMLMTLQQAKALQQVSGGSMTLFSALQNVTGGNTQAAQAIARVASSPDLIQQMMENMKHENRRRQLGERDDINYRSTLFQRGKTGLRSVTDFGIGRGVADWNARRDQELREYAMGIFGGDRDADRMMQMSPEQRNRAIKTLADTNINQKYGVDAMDDDFGAPSWSVAPWQRFMGRGYLNRVANEFMGYDFMGGRALRWMVGARQQGGTEMKAGLSPLAMFDTGLESLDDRSVARMAFQSADISKRVFQRGDARSIASASALLSESGGEVAKRFGLDESGQLEMYKRASTALDATFKKRRGWFNTDAKVSYEGVQSAVKTYLKEKGFTDDKISAFMASDKFKDYQADVARMRMATRSQSEYDYERSMHADYFKMEGTMWGKAQEESLDKIREATVSDQKANQGGSGWMGAASTIRGAYQMGRVAASQFSELIGASGASSDSEIKDAVTLTRMLAKKEKGTLKEGETQELLLKLKKGKSKGDSDKLDKILQRLEKKFGGLSEKNSIATSLASDYVDTDKLGTVVAEQTSMIHAALLDKTMRDRLKDRKIDLEGEEGSTLNILERKAQDKGFMQDMMSKGGWHSQLAEHLQKLREGKKDARRDTADFITKGAQPKTGVSFVGGPPDAAAASQMQMMQQLYASAADNQRNTKVFGTIVDRMQEVVSGKDSFKSAVADFKKAVDSLQTKMLKK